MSDPLLSQEYLQLELGFYRVLSVYYDAISRSWRAHTRGDTQAAQQAVFVVRGMAADVQAAIGEARRYLQQFPESEQIEREIEHLSIFQNGITIQLAHLPPQS
jgi:hypothetical protein